MKRSVSSKRWLAEHHADPYVKRAQREGLRSRAVFKLAQLEDKERLFKPKHVVVDLGAAPGGWSQYAIDRVGSEGQVYALDKLAMVPIRGVNFIQGDFTCESVLAELQTAMQATQADIIMSDMAPEFTGVKQVDKLRALHLAELAFAFCEDVLKPRGTLLIKFFHGVGIEELIKEVRRVFKKVRICKPDASRSRSSEAYLLATGYNGSVS